MVTREEILVLGLTAGVTGCLVGGLMFGIGMGLVADGIHIGWLLALPGAPVAGLTGYLTVLATESDVLEARRAGVLLAARGCQLDVDLKRALGGGFEPPVTVAQHAQD
jgi:hypothetical protein